jgi:hypothetical protein
VQVSISPGVGCVVGSRTSVLAGAAGDVHLQAFSESGFVSGSVSEPAPPPM